MYITKSNGNAGHQAIQGAMGKAGVQKRVNSCSDLAFTTITNEAKSKR
jgi:hypothetical protein